jgi:hypothetical protein
MGSQMTKPQVRSIHQEVMERIWINESITKEWRVGTPNKINQ